MIIIKVSEQFSEFPAGRYLSDGEFSGERFREQYLLPSIQKDNVCVDFDGAMGYGSSFLEEAFGGLVRVNKLSKSNVLNILTFKSIEEPSLITEVQGYIKEAIKE